MLALGLAGLAILATLAEEGVAHSPFSVTDSTAEDTTGTLDSGTDNAAGSISDSAEETLTSHGNGADDFITIHEGMVERGLDTVEDRLTATHLAMGLAVTLAVGLSMRFAVRLAMRLAVGLGHCLLLFYTQNKNHGERGVGLHNRDNPYSVIYGVFIWLIFCDLFNKNIKMPQASDRFLLRENRKTL